jgi:hypothetical protein
MTKPPKTDPWLIRREQAVRELTAERGCELQALHLGDTGDHDPLI